MLFSLVAVSCLLAVHATPVSFIDPALGMDISRGILEDVVGTGTGRSMDGMRNIGGIERSGSEYGRLGSDYDRQGSEYGRQGSEYGRQGSVGSSSGYGSRGYEREGSSSSHDIGHLDRDFKQITESHVSEGHNSGHREGYGSRGGESEGHRSYGADENEFGGRFYSGLGV